MGSVARAAESVGVGRMEVPLWLKGQAEACCLNPHRGPCEGGRQFLE